MMRLVTLLLVCAAIGLQPGLVRAQGASPVGLWRTFDDRTGKERGLVRHLGAERGSIRGRVVSTVDPADANKTCGKCTGDRKDKPVIGLDIIRGLHQDGEQWSGGEILDPENGATYRCSIRVEDGGRKLSWYGVTSVSRCSDAPRHGYGRAEHRRFRSVAMEVQHELENDRSRGDRTLRSCRSCRRARSLPLRLLRRRCRMGHRSRSTRPRR